MTYTTSRRHILHATDTVGGIHFWKIFDYLLSFYNYLNSLIIINKIIFFSLKCWFFFKMIFCLLDISLLCKKKELIIFFYFLNLKWPWPLNGKVKVTIRIKIQGKRFSPWWNDSKTTNTTLRNPYDDFWKENLKTFIILTFDFEVTSTFGSRVKFKVTTNFFSN